VVNDAEKRQEKRQKQRETKNKRTIHEAQNLDNDEDSEGLLPEGCESDIQKVREMLEEAICSGQKQVSSLLCTALKSLPMCWKLYDEGRLLEYSLNLRRQSKNWAKLARMKLLADGPQRKKELMMQYFVAETVQEYRLNNSGIRR